MQPRKDSSFSEINRYCKNERELVTIFKQLLNVFDLRYINSLFSKVKKQGVDGKVLFQTLFVIRFLNFSNVNQLMQSGIAKELTHKKDALYDFLNNPKINWRTILWLFSKQVLKIIDNKSIDDDQDRKRYLIFDDTVIPKTGKTMELIGKVFNHTNQGYTIGMKKLTLGYSDGKSFIPLDFSIHHEPGKNKNRGLKKRELDKQFSKKRPKDSPGYERVTEINKSKIDVALSMLKRYLKKSLKVDYILADSWFISENFIKTIRKYYKKVHVVGLMMINRKLIINGEEKVANKVPETFRKEIKRRKSLKCSYIKKRVTYKGVELTAFWIKMFGQNNWKLLITTEKNASLIKTMKVYQVRWSIEVFFKDCKQSLKLNSCQSKHFDAHIATISLVFMNYAILALRRRFEDYETIGQLFRHCKEFILEQSIVEKIWKMFNNIMNSFLPKLGADLEKVMLQIIEDENLFAEEWFKNFDNLFAFSQRE